MRWTQTLIPTLKETPEGAEAASHVLMLRAGIIRQVAAGAYAYLPLGLRALRKAEQLIRREFDAAGAVELAMPALTPVSLWDQAGRTRDFGDELIQLDVGRQGRKARLVLAPAHDEVITDLMAQHVSSYRQLPVTLHQVQTKFRDEPRPRLGLLRTREFLTHDAYSFDPSPESLDKSYLAILAAYRRIFDRMGLDCLLAEAGCGPDSGDPGHEFVVPAEIGEHTVAHCQECGYTANRERAEVGPLGTSPSATPAEPVRQVDTPNATTIDQVSRMLGCRPDEMIKTLIYSADSKPLAVLIRGDHEANEAKIRLATGATQLELAPSELIERVTGAPVGFAGPVALGKEVAVWADRDVEFMRNAVTGANRVDVHLTGVNPERDFQVRSFADLRYAVDGDPCPRCSSTVAICRVIELARTVKLGARLSEPLAARFLDDHEQQHPILTGSYQLGVSRLLAAMVETGHDARGIIWPVGLAPYEVLVLPLGAAQSGSIAVAERLYDDLSAAGIDVLLDDRDARAGAKFHDADLVGVPLRVVVGPRGLEDGDLEIKWRWDEEPQTVALDAASERITELILTEREEGARLKNRQTSH